MKPNDITPGVTIVGKKWPEPVEVKKVDYSDDYIHIIGATALTGQHIDQLILVEELSNIHLEKIVTDFRGKCWKVFLGLEGRRYRFASLYDPLLAMNTSKVDPLPHQIEAVYGYILKIPRIRFLIADDPGAGKTIMAGLVAKELKLRHLVKRILIVVPGHLKDQWRREMKERFDEPFVVVDRGLIDSYYGENVWERENQIITSMDFVKREEIISSIASTKFDLIIVDEAHKMTGYKYGDKTVKTERYRLGEVLSTSADPHLLFLTATPHKGDPENFRMFMDLLEPGFFATTEMLQESIKNKDNPLFIRRIKEDMKDFEGKPIFLPRHVKTIGFSLSLEEKILYNDVSRYVHEQYNRALMSDKRRNIAFALVILQRRLASSTYAILRSLERRKTRLQEMLDGTARIKPAERSFDFEEFDDLNEEERWKEEELLETLSITENRLELESEIGTIQGLIEQSRSIIQAESEVKVTQLKETIIDLNKKFSSKKILVFTEAKDTLEYLEKKIRSWGFSVNTIHGGMRLEDRVSAEGIFKNETQIMVATEAAGEGINLQFCHLMINYDIPWKPNRLEQRLGRIHRYGQTREVYAFNLVAEDTREGQVLSKLFEKLDEIRKALHTDKVFDVISEVVYGTDLSRLLLEAAASARSMDEILKEIDIKVDEEYIMRVKNNLGESLASRYIDYTRLKEMEEKARENRLIPEYTQAFFKKVLLGAGGRMKEKSDGLVSIDSIPYEIRSIAGEDSFKKRFGSLMRNYPKATFDKDVRVRNSDAEFVSFGHPLFEAALEWVERELTKEMQQGAVFEDPDGLLDGYLLFYEGEVKDGTGSVAGKSLFAYFVDSKGSTPETISPTVIWDLAESKTPKLEKVDVDSLKENVRSNVIKSLKNYMKKIQDDRLKQAAIKEKYGIRSMDKLILDLDGDLIALNERKQRKENVDIAIRNKEERKRKYEHSKRELEDIIEKEKNLTMSMPNFSGIIKVIPSKTVQVGMRRDDALERIGMEVTMQYERDAGRKPEDVSKENLGFDVRSKDKKGKPRYIEVKARAGVGAIALTQNEWFKAQRLADDYYLYVVWNAGKDPKNKPLIIRNPAQNISVKEKVESVRYLVPPEEIRRKGGI